jgi:type VI secretion system secreted protein VgrG
MAATFTQANSPMKLTTPLGPDALLLTGLTVTEGISQLFRIQLDVIAKNDTDVPFDKLLGQKATVELETLPRQTRFFNGVIIRVGQGGRDEVFTSYQLELAPQFWLLTRRWQSRIFQHVSVPDILKTVFQGLDVAFEIQGTFEKRDYCVQYRESDFNFASRLMEEDGIYYFFKHANGSHQMIVANTPQSHPDVPQQSKVIFEEALGGNRQDLRIFTWGKVQELRSGKYTLFDHAFQLPHKHLEADKLIADSVQVGQVTHKVKVANNDKLEVFDFPGEYAQRFDDIDKGGGEQPAELQKIFTDNKRTVAIRMEQEAVPGLVIQGSSNCRQFVTGNKFTLDKHFNANGAYLLTGVTHVARQNSFFSGDNTAFEYSNSFVCIPFAQPFRPQRVALKSIIQGTQTAVVVGPAAEEIFTDKYSRVKVQFHWDRQGKNDADSSCWVRVGTPWAGKQWGMIHIPRVGQEVIVDFLEGDPDQPIIMGSVYNADQMPPYKLPDKKTQSGLKTRSTLKGSPDNFNELRFEDKKGSEDIVFHAEKDFHRSVENDDDLTVGNDQTITITNNRTEKVQKGDEKITIEEGDRSIEVTKGDDSHLIKEGDRNVEISQGDDSLLVKQGNRAVEISMGDDSLLIKMGNQTTKLNLGSSSTEAMQSIELKVGQSSLKVDQMGVSISGMMIKIEGQVQTSLKGLITQLSADAMMQVKGGITMIG